MTIAPGTPFGTFEILAPLGAGGMGEVYRARDTRLHREVALKLLPADFARDPERVERLTREARMLASLSHPNIGTIHGIEEQAGEIALVLELVEGPTLADRLKAGPLPTDSAIAMARQIAEALEAAHERGIIHRDLKPANIKIATSGKVTVLDFGIAKALRVEAAVPATDAGVSFATTRSGMVIGTPGYMSPEQATSGEVDRRADIWAFGCVVFEALAGRGPFAGATVAEILVGVLEREPDWKALPRDVSPALEDLLARCLRKDARHRLQDIGDARIAIEEMQAGHARAFTSLLLPRRQSFRRSARAWTIATGLMVLALSLAGLWGVRQRAVPVASPAQLVVQLPPGVVLPLDTEHPVLALSPDGTVLVFVGESGGTRRLYQRALRDAESRPIPGTEDAASPFFSPNGDWVGFFVASTIRKVATAGGPPVTVHASTPMTVNRGASWMGADSVIFAASANSGLTLSSMAGAPPLPHSKWVYITRDVNAAYAWPEALPDGRTVLFTDNGSDERVSTPAQSRVSALSRTDKAVTTLVNGATSARYSATGHLLFARTGALYATYFDANRARINGPERRILDSVIAEPNGAAHFAVSASGVLAYIKGGTIVRQHELVWVDRQGTAVQLLDNGRAFSFPRLSPDGNRLALGSPTGANDDVWILDLTRKTLDRVTSHAGEDFEPVWNPDGSRLAMASERNDDEGPGLAWTISANFQLEGVLRTPGIGNWEYPTSWSPDGKWLAYTRDRAGSASDVELLPTSGAPVPVPFAATAASEMAGMFSPSGRWMAYVSDATGRNEVYVQPFPGPGAREQLSANGGTEPQWSRDGRELFYREGARLMAVPVGVGAALTPGVPVMLFEGRYDQSPYGGRSANYDVAPDGRHFLMVRRKRPTEPTVIHIVFNWPAALLARQEATKP